MGLEHLVEIILRRAVHEGIATMSRAQGAVCMGTDWHNGRARATPRPYTETVKAGSPAAAGPEATQGGGVTALGRAGSGLSMILAPLLWLASSALGPGHEASRSLADMLPPIAADPDRFLASVVFGLLSLVLLIPAVLGVAQLLHRRRPLLALTGAGLVLVGILSSAVLHGVQLVQHQMIHPAADREQMVELLARLEAGIGPKVMLVGLFVGLFLGWVILSAGLFTTRVVPRAIPVAIFASLMLNSPVSSGSPGSSS